ncbi:hypothetical protein ACFV1L_29685 [Kitasatospora sp. NPDC059646]|uniref:hypothetical protein n=1 Tax=Kitasatospora sp. NPDC059646 TaxID=3346893 RepID=UPI003688BD29
MEDCQEGYSATLFEYWNDLSVRGFLQTVIESLGAEGAPEAAWFIAEVAEIDLRFKNLIEGGFDISGRWGWWEQKIPRFSGENMARDVRDQFGFEMEVL